MRQRATGQTTPIVVTSYLDHPVGQSFAAYQAALALAKGHELDTCGLVTHSVYTDTPFTARLAAQQGVLIPSSGTGIGFDEELESLTWADLES
jgi:O-succinylbenzoate synthase